MLKLFPLGETKMTDESKLTSICKDDGNDELLVDLPAPVIDTLKAKPGDELIWTIDESGEVTIRKKWTAQCINAGDGSGDVIVELPEALLEQIGWKIGDKLDLSVSGGTITLKKTP